MVSRVSRSVSLPPILQKLRIPVIGSPMFIVSNPALVIAQCTSGIVGSFPALNARPAELLDEWLQEITRLHLELAARCNPAGQGGHDAAPWSRGGLD